jgi:hypothetical protein
MKITQQSLPLTELIRDIIQDLGNQSDVFEDTTEQIQLRNAFLHQARRFVDHYPKAHSEGEEQTLKQIDLMMK